MAGIDTVLCIHRDPGQLSVLRTKGYGLVTATNGSEGLRLLMSKSVDAVLLEYHLGLLDGAVVAEEIRQVRPRLPIVMLTESRDLPQGALKSVDAVVAKSDGPHFLLATLQSVLRGKNLLHLKPPSGEQEQRPWEDTLRTSRRIRILVVDDDAGVRESVAMSLSAAGYDAVMANDGFHALAQLREKLPDVLVSDLHMPGMSGFELLSVVRRRFPQISTVAMSGAYVGNEVPPGVIADGFFSKGGESRNLIRKIHQLICTTANRRSDHDRECAPAWIWRNGNDSQGMPYVVLTCAQCLRAFPLNLLEQSGADPIHIPCRFCGSLNRYLIQPSFEG